MKQMDQAIKIRIEFRERVKRMMEMYIDFCDDDWINPTTEGFMEFMYDDEQKDT